MNYVSWEAVYSPIKTGVKKKKNSTNLELLDQIALQDCVGLEVSVKKMQTSL